MSPSSGSGTVSPIGVGAGVGITTAQPLPYTLLSLNKFAKVLGINPAHFWGCTASSLDPVVMPIRSACDSIWFQYSWQDVDKVSRFDIAQTIYQVEQEISDKLGYFPAPNWVAKERRAYPRPYRREYFGGGLDVRGMEKSIHPSYGKIIEVGRRAVSLIATATTASGSLTYSDEDGDGLEETATIVVATTANPCEIKVYHTGTDGVQEWEIRDYKSKTVSGGVATIVFDSWLLIDPELYAFLPDSNGARAIDISTTTNYVSSVDVYREYTDTAQASAEFYWENEAVGCAACGGSGCEACGLVIQTGCSRIQDSRNGYLSLIPASYDATTGEWSVSTWDGYREPDHFAVWYYSGKESNEYLAGRTCEPLPWDLARIIAHMTVARLERPFCECGNVRELSEYLRIDLIRRGRDFSYYPTELIMTCPFGTRIGEVEAWRVVSKSQEKISKVAVI